jgi:hypothetical protein
MARPVIARLKAMSATTLRECAEPALVPKERFASIVMDELAPWVCGKERWGQPRYGGVKQVLGQSSICNSFKVLRGVYEPAVTGALLSVRQKTRLCRFDDQVSW